MTDSVYLTPDEWQNMATGIDFSTLTTDEMEALIEQASLLAEAEAGMANGGTWLLKEYSEQHVWRATHRVYVYNWPVISVGSLALRVGAQVSASIPLLDLYINNGGHWIEVSSLALAFGVAPEIVSLGLAQPIVEVTYTAGYDVIPSDIKYAVAIIASAVWLNKKLFEEGTAGVVSFTIGSYQVSFGTKQLGGVAGFGNFVPDQAKFLLRSYKFAPFLR